MSISFPTRSLRPPLPGSSKGATTYNTQDTGERLGLAQAVLREGVSTGSGGGCRPLPISHTEPHGMLRSPFGMHQFVFGRALEPSELLNSYFRFPPSPSVCPKAPCLSYSMPQCFLFSFPPIPEFCQCFLVCSKVIRFPFCVAQDPPLCPSVPPRVLCFLCHLLMFSCPSTIALQSSPFVLICFSLPVHPRALPLAFGKLPSGAGTHLCCPLCCPSSHSCPQWQ